MTRTYAGRTWTLDPRRREWHSGPYAVRYVDLPGIGRVYLACDGDGRQYVTMSAACEAEVAAFDALHDAPRQPSPVPALLAMGLSALALAGMVIALVWSS